MIGRWHGKIPIAITLATAIGILVLAATGIVSAVAVWLAKNNTFDLLSANVYQAISADVTQIELHLRPAEHQTQFIAEKIAQGEIDPAKPDEFGLLLTGALAAVPQIGAVLFIDKDLQSISVGRDDQSTEIDLFTADFSQDSIVRDNMAKVRKGPIWLKPIWRDRVQKTYLNRAHPVRRNGEFIGAVVSAVSVEQLSNFISEKGFDTTGNRFILYGRNQVLAHWLLMDEYPDRSDNQPLPSLDTFSDPVLAAIWQSQGRRELPLDFPLGTDSFVLEMFDTEYVFLYKTLVGYGQQPMIVGAYFTASDIPEEVRRFVAALSAGGIVLLLSLIAAIILGRRIARPIVKFSAAAGRVRNLDVSKVEELPGSIFRELNDQSVAFNAMLRALRWFEMYVPRKIVEHLIRHGDIQDTNSDARELTVMFTDVVGFSSISEDMSAPEVAAFINSHFSLIVSCIEAEGGTVDKFMGDAVMAFWGAPELPSHDPERACRAALAIAVAMQKDNKKRQLSGQPSVGIRIGIHTGIATVGNIGAPGRLNYTIIGDTVNIGQRLEQLGKQVYSHGREISILISHETARKLSSEFKSVSIGNFKLKGRAGDIAVFELGGYPGNE